MKFGSPGISRARLTAEGHDVLVAHEGESALRQAKETRYQLIVLDVMLPGIDGFEVLRQPAQGAC